MLRRWSTTHNFFLVFISWKTTIYRCYYKNYWSGPIKNVRILIKKKLLEKYWFYTCLQKIIIIWCMVPEKWSEINNFLSLWAMFCPFTPVVTQKIKISKKWKKGLCTKNQDHNMMYASWDVECGRHNFLLFWAIFCPFTLLTIQKIKILKKNAWRYYPFIHTYHKWRSCDV